MTRSGMVFAVAVSVKGGGDPRAARLLAKLIDVLVGGVVNFGQRSQSLWTQ